MTVTNGRKLWAQRHGKAPKQAPEPAPAAEPADTDQATTEPTTTPSALTPRAGIDPDQLQTEQPRDTGSVTRGRARWTERTGRPRWQG